MTDGDDMGLEITVRQQGIPDTAWAVVIDIGLAWGDGIGQAPSTPCLRGRPTSVICCCRITGSNILDVNETSPV